MKFVSFILAFTFFAFTLQAKNVKPEEAKKIAKNYYWERSNVTVYDSIIPKLIYTGKYRKETTFYVFQFVEKKGFVIVAADDIIKPVLAYSLKNKFDVNNIPINAKGWLEYYNKVIVEAKKEKVKQTKEIAGLWKKYKTPARNKNIKMRSTNAVAPLLTTTWNQNKYYNTDCPEDSDGPDGHVYAGCVATAMAQVMKYNSYPIHGIGEHSYVHDVYGEQYANFGATTYEWDNMPDDVTSYNDDVAQLLYHCGVSVDMNYGPNSSSAHIHDAEYALKEYFGYSNDVDEIYKSDYSDADWKTTIRNQLDNGWAMVYAGYSSDSGGHAFVCDGYDDNDNFHFNWGWSGSCDGYYALDDLTPCGYDFTDGQRAIINIYSDTTVPDCTTLTSPQDGDTDVDVNADLEWEEISDATGYVLSIGTFPEGTDILDNEYVGNVTTYDPGHLPYSSTIYVTITPFNSAGSAYNCDEESFETEAFDYESAFRMEIYLENSDFDFTIPTEGDGYFYDVDWGDDTYSYNQTGDASHTYSSGGKYTISISGDFPRIYFNNSSDAPKLINIKQWGSTAWVSMANAFEGCYNMSISATDVPDLSLVTDMSHMFEGATSFEGDNIDEWDVSNVADMSATFKNTGEFNKDISNWNVSNVTDMTSMFENAQSFNQDISNWDVGNVQNMSYMFKDAEVFDQDLGDWNITGVSNMEGMFDNIALSIANYDSILIKWEAQDVQSGVSFSGGNSKYCDGRQARERLINDKGWTIVDGGKDCPDLECTTLIDPAPGSTGVPIYQDLTWNDVQYADGYFLYIGTAPDSYDFLNGVDVGNTTTYDPGDFPCGTTMYVTIIPYNDEGDAEGCLDESFETEYVIADAGEDVETCSGSSVQLNATGGTTYHWTPEAFLDNPDIANPWASPPVDTDFVVTVSIDGRCPETDTVHVTVLEHPEPHATATPETATGANDGTATCNPTGGVPGYTYLWSTGDTTQTITGLAPGMYYVTVTDSKLCQGIDSAEVLKFQCQNLSLEYEQNDVKCFGECDGSIAIVNVIDGDAPFTYQWSTGSTDSLITGLCAGTYNVTVTDSKNCVVKKNFIITQPDAALTVSISSTDETANDANDGTANVTAAGGIAPYTYNWSTGDTTQNISGLAPGTYFVTVTDGNGCTAVDSAIINAYICPVLSVNSQYINASCYGACDGSATITGVDSAAIPLIYAWSTGDSTASVNNLCAGSYTVTITDNKNCSVVDTFVISQPDEIIITVDSTGDIRTGALGYIAISTNDTGNYTYHWTGPGDFNADTEDLDSLDNEGCYTLTVTDTTTNCSVDSTICIEDKTATFDIYIENIKIYPNPANDKFTIDISIPEAGILKEINIFDVSGSKRMSIKAKRGKSVYQIDTGNKLTSGLYIVQIKFENYKTFYKKVVLDR